MLEMERPSTAERFVGRALGLLKLGASQAFTRRWGDIMHKVMWCRPVRLFVIKKQNGIDNWKMEDSFARNMSPSYSSAIRIWRLEFGILTSIVTIGYIALVLEKNNCPRLNYLALLRFHILLPFPLGLLQRSASEGGRHLKAWQRSSSITGWTERACWWSLENRWSLSFYWHFPDTFWKSEWLVVLRLPSKRHPCYRWYGGTVWRQSLEMCPRG